jgi:hypothetical protein
MKNIKEEDKMSDDLKEILNQLKFDSNKRTEEHAQLQKQLFGMAICMIICAIMLLIR